jgi:hypothetical protein
MRDRIALASVVSGLVIAAAIPFAGCDKQWDGTGPATPNQSQDSGGGGNGDQGDAGEGDAGVDGGGIDMLADGQVPPQGTQLAQGASLAVEGVTSDGYAIYSDSSKMTLSAAPLDGGAPVSIGPTDTAGANVQVIGPVVFNWTAVNQNTGSATLTIWTSSGSAQKVATASQAPSGFEAAAVSADGTTVAFLTNLSVDGNTADLAVASVSSATATTVASGINIGDMACFPVFAFAGSSLVAAYPTPAGDAGTGAVDAGPVDAGSVDASAPAVAYVGTVTAFSGATWTPTTLATEAVCNVGVDPTGAQVLVSTKAGLRTQTLATPSVPTVLDAKGVWGQFAQGSGADAGLDVVYTDDATALKRVAASGKGTPLVLVTSGLRNVAALSPDNAWALATNLVEVGTAQTTTDLYLASATTGGTTATALATTASVIQMGDWFTADSTQVLYGVASSGGVNALYSAATSGGKPVQLSSDSGFAYATTKGTIIFNNNDSDNGYDLLELDTSSATNTPTLLVSLADEAFFLSAGRDQIVYTWSTLAGSSLDGLYAMPVP